MSNDAEWDWVPLNTSNNQQQACSRGPERGGFTLFSKANSRRAKETRTKFRATKAKTMN